MFTMGRALIAMSVVLVEISFSLYDNEVYEQVSNVLIDEIER